MSHFIVLGLPRSMTAWVSCFLTCGDVFCQHELSGKVARDDRVHDFIERLNQPFPVSGVADPGLLGWDEYQEVLDAISDLKIIYIHRQLEDVVKSFARVTNLPIKVAQPYLEEMLDAAIALPSEVFTFDELQTPEGATRLWEAVAPHVPLPPAHLEKMMTLKVVQNPKMWESLMPLVTT